MHKSIYEEVVKENKKKRERIRELDKLLMEAQEDVNHSRTTLQLKSQEYNTSYATSSPLPSFRIIPSSLFLFFSPLPFSF